MKHLFTCSALLLLAACAGNPPAWWNPQNRYGSVDGTPAALQPVRVKKTSAAMEQSIEPLADTSYEEETISLPEESEPAASEVIVEEGELPSPSVLE